MTKAFIAKVLRESCELTHAGATAAAGDLINAIVEQLKRDGKFNLPGFGTFTVAKTKAHIGMNPRTGEKIKVKAGKTRNSTPFRSRYSLPSLNLFSTRFS